MEYEKCTRCGHPLARIDGIGRCLYCGWATVPRPPTTRITYSEEIMQSVESFVDKCHERLLCGEGSAKTYLKYRGVSEESIEKWKIGYIPEDPDIPGIWSRNQHLWGNRILFPIWDQTGRYVIAAGARKFSVDDRPKYVNSSESQFFHKRNNLYGSWNIPAHTDVVFLCEGYLDVISMVSRMKVSGRETAGSKTYSETHAVASLGTALTSEQAAWLRERTNFVCIAYDADEPGQEATKKALTVLNQAGFPYEDISVLTLEGGKDVDEVLTKGGTMTEMTVYDWFGERGDTESQAKIMLG